MQNIHDNVYIPDEGYRYITNGKCWSDRISLGRTDDIGNWHDTNDGPPAAVPEEEATAEDYEAALERLGVE